MRRRSRQGQSPSRLGERMSKANFDHIYTAPDPRPYFQTLDGLDYQIPAHGASLFSAVAEHVAEVRDRDTVRIADLCCSYGINAAVMKHEPTFDEIVAHYTTDDCQALDRDDLLARDRAFFEERRDGSALEVVGIDVSSEAIGYAVEAGILDGGAAEDLETRDPSPQLTGLLESTDLVTVTGGIGYITERTVGRVLDAVPTTPWIAALCLRWVDFDDVAEAGRARDMVVHRLDDVTFPQTPLHRCRGAAARVERARPPRSGPHGSRSRRLPPRRAVRAPPGRRAADDPAPRAGRHAPAVNR